MLKKSQKSVNMQNCNDDAVMAIYFIFEDFNNLFSLALEASILHNAPTSRLRYRLDDVVLVLTD